MVTESGYYDVHAHLADSRLDGIASDMIDRARTNGVRGILVNAARYEEWENVIELTRFSECYGALGIHPFFLDGWSEDVLKKLEENVLQNKKIVAIGEIGLDFFNGRDDQDLQIKVFSAQLRLAKKMNLPVVCHNRKSWSDFLSIVIQKEFGGMRIICHNFSSSEEVARELLDLGFFLSFCGPVTWKNAHRIKKAARYVPLDRMLTETDAPDLPCRQYKGKLSEPAHVADIVNELALIKETTVTKIKDAVETNFKNVIDYCDVSK